MATMGECLLTLKTKFNETKVLKKKKKKFYEEKNITTLKQALKESLKNVKVRQKIILFY